MTIAAKMNDFQVPGFNRAMEGRRELMQKVTDFALKHDVALTGPNLASIVSALSGSDAALARAFAAREFAQDPISQDWLDQLARPSGEKTDQASALESLMERLETTLRRYTEITQSAQNETSEHRGAIDAQIAKMAQSADASQPRAELDRLIDLSRAMLDRIVRVEAAMAKSQEETAELRASLAEARSEADVDHLTRLPNRRAFERELAKTSQEAETNNTLLSVAFCDVDHFKAVNDTHGHDAGDRVLVAIARTLKRYSGSHCFAARHGGEEFALLFPGLGGGAARDKLDHIRRDIASRQMINRENGQSFGTITFSGGVAEVQSVSDAREALARADGALYEAKEAGRNRIGLA